MATPAPARCPRCGRELPGGTLEGVCPACLMRQAMANEPSDVTEESESVQFTTGLASTRWTLVTLIADDEECVTYLARTREAAGDEPDTSAAKLAQLVVRKQHVPPGEQAAARRQLHRRCEALRQLSHPALAPVLDAGLTDEGHPFLVTAFVMATPLADLVDLTHLADPPDAAVRTNRAVRPPSVPELLDQAQAALQALHNAGLAHGRVRAATVLGRRTRAGATTVVTGYAPLPALSALSLAIADDLSQLERLTSTLRV